MVKVAHESPISIFNLVRSNTDICYALVHLFEENEEYYQKFVESVNLGREVILDNSIFELEEAFDADKFASWVSKLNPTWYIVPDKLEDKDNTISQFIDFTTKYNNLPGKSIGVVQGKNYEEVVECYNVMSKHADMIAISFDYSFFEDLFPNEQTKFHKWVKGRQYLIQKLEDEGVINKDKPHHLLGTGLPQEFEFYKNKPYIYSCDTSNPVIHGLLGKKYQLDDKGIYCLDNKESVKLFTLINSELTSEQISNIMYNIEKFKENINDK